MLTDTTVNKLNEMKLTTMSRVFREQLTDPNISKLSFEDRFGLLVDQEWTSRKNNHLKRLISNLNATCINDIKFLGQPFAFTVYTVPGYSRSVIDYRNSFSHHSVEDGALPCGWSAY